ncbi:MAG: hypothetical protein EWM72_00383 [Nitrospira sp.]|nr:MAG: hypothetical protein EWM72_00383 [Nitrospira sp.]
MTRFVFAACSVICVVYCMLDGHALQQILRRALHGGAIGEQQHAQSD